MINTGTETIRDFYGKILGTITTQSNGDKIARDFYGRIVGKYDSYCNVTRDFYGKILSKGDSVSATIYDNEFTRK